MTVLVEFQYFPPVILIKKIVEFSNVKFDIYDEYRKMSFRNRCVLAGGAGKVNLSIPLVEGRNQRRPSKEVRIDNKTDWQGQHWKTITSCYNRSPWFEFYKHDLEELYRRRVEWLVDWNMICWNWLMEKLEAEVRTTVTGEFQSGKNNSEFQSRKDDSEFQPGKNPSEFQSGKDDSEFQPGKNPSEFQSGKDDSELQPGKNPSEFQPQYEPLEFLDWRNKLLPRTINLEFPEPVRYRQVFEDRTGFIPHLSILDLLFCAGRQSVEILKSAKIPI